MVSVPQVTDPVHPTENKWGTAFRAEARVLRSELEAQRNVKLETSRYWKVVNNAKENRSGGPTGYKLLAGHNTAYMGSPSSSIIARAGFLKNHLWVTKYARSERFPAGDFPNQNVDEGLPLWTRRDA